MTQPDFDAVAFPDSPELVIGLVAPIGTPIKYFTAVLKTELEKRDYDPVDVKLSRYAEILAVGGKVTSADSYERYDRLMTLGNDMRKLTSRNDILALFAATEISSERPKEEPRHLAATAFVVSQLKHPEEVYRFRRTYGDNFILIGLYCPKYLRQNYLNRFIGMSEEKAVELIGRDEDEALRHGQRVSDTYHLADVFIRVTGDEGKEDVSTEVGRLLDLLFGRDIVTPTRDEYGMFLASAGALRSSSLARQVGAAILTKNTEVLAVGSNEVPCYGGGLYWGDERAEDGELQDARDHAQGYDTSDRMKFEILGEILEHVIPNWKTLGEDKQKEVVSEVLSKLRGARVTSLTEFVRAVHAEMEAISSATRTGVSVKGATLYGTTFPCHGCAKHIVAAGIIRVVFIEPYPKSMALRMHNDSIVLKGEEDDQDIREPRVVFEQFVGVAPRRYQQLFSRVTPEGRRPDVKDEAGTVIRGGQGFRLPATPYGYVFRENLAAKELKRIRESTDQLKEVG